MIIKSLVDKAEVKKLIANLSLEVLALREEKRECRRWSGTWHNIDGQIKALTWAIKEVKGLLR